VKTYRGHGWSVLDLDVSKDNSRIASCGEDKLIFLWDVASGRVIRKLRGHTSRVNCIKFNEDSSVAVSGSYDKTVKLWDLKSNSFEPIQVLNHAKDSISSVCITKTEILVSSVDGNLRTYDIRSGTLTTDCVGQPVTSTTLSHDGNCVLLGCLDDKLRLLDKSGGELLNEYSSHHNTNYKIDSCFTNDDAFLMSGSEDHLIYVWDLVEPKVVAKLKGHTAAVVGLHCHPRDNTVLSCSSDSTIKIWK